LNNKNKTLADKSLLSLTWPIFIDLFFIFMINVTDAWFLSQISDNAAAAAGAMLPILGIGFAFYSTLHQAGNSVAGQRIGAKDHKKIASTYGILTLLLLIAGLIMAAIFFLGASTFSSWMGLSGDIAQMSQVYLSTLGLGTWILALRFATNSILASQGKTTWNMWSTTLMSLINIIGNYILIDGKFGAPAMGIQGIAIASIIAWLASLLFNIVIITYHFKVSIVFPRSWLSLKEHSVPLVKIAAPSVIEPLSWQLVQLLMTTMVVVMGATSLATRIYCFNIIYIGILYGFAISAGVQLKVAYLIGANKYKSAQNELIKGVKIGLIGIVIFLICIISFSQLLFQVFTDNQEIWLLGSTILFISIFSEIGRSLNLIVGASLRACGDAKFTSIVGFTSMWFIALPLAWYFGIYLSWGLVGIYIGSSLDEALRGTSNILRWNSGEWQSKGLYAKSITK
jgi:putative MATE family efflux protein